MSYLIVDIETVPDPDLPFEPKPGDPDPFPPIPCHKIVMIGVALLDRKTFRTKKLGIIGGLDQLTKEPLALKEINILRYFSKYVEETEPTIVTFNGRGFDLPCIVARSMRHELAIPWYYQRRDMRYRYSDEGHFDVMDFLADYRASRPYGLDLAARLCGWSGKMKLDESVSQTLQKPDGSVRLATYNLIDVVCTGAVFIRTAVARGWLNLQEALIAETSLMDQCEAHPLLSNWLPRNPELAWPWKNFVPCPDRESNGVQCELPEGHSGPHECPAALADPLED